MAVAGSIGSLLALEVLGSPSDAPATATAGALIAASVGSDWGTPDSVDVTAGSGGKVGETSVAEGVFAGAPSVQGRGQFKGQEERVGKSDVLTAKQVRVRTRRGDIRSAVLDDRRRPNPATMVRFGLPKDLAESPAYGSG